MSRYALIKDGKVDNVIVSNPHNTNKIARLKDMTAVYADDYPIQKGDDYSGGTFSRNGEEIKKPKSPQQLINEMQEEFDDVTLDQDFRLSLIEMGVSD